MWRVAVAVFVVSSHCVVYARCGAASSVREGGLRC
jgi:hypothetical protein